MAAHTQTIGTIHFRQNTKATLRRVKDKGEQFLVTANGEEMAMLIPVELYNRLTGPVVPDGASDFYEEDESADDVLRAWNAAGEKGTTKKPETAPVN